MPGGACLALEETRAPKRSTSVNTCAGMRAPRGALLGVLSMRTPTCACERAPAGAHGGARMGTHRAAHFVLVSVACVLYSIAHAVGSAACTVGYVAQ